MPFSADRANAEHSYEASLTHGWFGTGKRLQGKSCRCVWCPKFVGTTTTPRQRRYIARRSLESDVPIWPNVATICPADVSRKNLPGSLAQFCNSVEVASPPVLTCTVYIVR